MMVSLWYVVSSWVVLVVFESWYLLMGTK